MLLWPSSQIHRHLRVLVEGGHKFYFLIITKYLDMMQPILAISIASKTFMMNFPTSFN